jgi:hypothetical protein
MARCSYLGMPDDPTTAHEFASDGNLCYHALPAAPPNAAHQKAFCLADQHIYCPILLQAEKKPLPTNVILLENKVRFWENTSNRRVVPTVLVLLVVSLLVGVLSLTGILSPARAVREGPTTVKSDSPTIVATSSSLSIGSSDLTVEPTNNPNGTEVFCTPPDGWSVYTVIPTDSIYRLSLIYGVSVADLETANCLAEGDSIRPGDLIYVPLFLTSTPTVLILTNTSTPRPTSTSRIIPFYSATPTEENRPPPPAPTPIPPTASPQPSNTPVPPTPTTPFEPATPTSPPETIIPTEPTSAPETPETPTIASP